MWGVTCRAVRASTASTSYLSTSVRYPAPKCLKGSRSVSFMIRCMSDESWTLMVISHPSRIKRLNVDRRPPSLLHHTISDSDRCIGSSICERTIDVQHAIQNLSGTRGSINLPSTSFPDTTSAPVVHGTPLYAGCLAHMAH